MVISKVKDSSVAKALNGKQKSKVKSDEKEAKVYKKLVKSKVGESKIATKKVEKKDVPKTDVKSLKKDVKIVANVYGKDGKVVGEVDLPKEIFDAKINQVLMSQAVRVYLANQRSGTASTKTRGQVRGSTRKIYRQKGTGRARHGAITAPIFVGGGIVFGPKPHSFSLKLSKKMKRLALFSALSSKFQNNQILILEDLDGLKAKTKEFVKILKNVNLLDKKGKAEKVLFVLPDKTESVFLSARNVNGLEIEKANLINTYEVLNSRHVVFSKNSINVLSKIFLKE